MVKERNYIELRTNVHKTVPKTYTLVANTRRVEGSRGEATKGNTYSKARLHNNKAQGTAKSGPTESLHAPRRRPLMRQEAKE